VQATLSANNKIPEGERSYIMNLELFREKILDGDREGIEALTKEAISKDISVGAIINGHLMPAMEEVGHLYEVGELYIPEMLVSARAMQASMAILKPLIVGDEVKTAGRVVIGTVEGDLHDIGKTLVGMMLEGAGFEVHDLGVNVKPKGFVEAVRDLKPAIVGMSALLTTTIPSMQMTIDALKEAGLRDGLIIMVGGAPVTSEFADSIGADGFAEDAAGAARRAKELIGIG
jgi:5-methyltetrahydrofolate--homocysteine methyltransferase